VRTAYRRLVQRHHPDHNGGSAESARRFEEVQDAYARIRALRSAGAATPRDRARASQAPPSDRGRRSTQSRSTQSRSTPNSGDGDVDARIAELERQLREARQARERELREAQQARERARQAAREASADTGATRPSDEELGYVTTDDSFSKIFSDALSELSERVSDVRKTSVGERVGDVIEDLDELASKLTRKHPPSKQD
jgi:curved DNA-binding protein CbpA